MDYFKILNLSKEPFSNSPDPEFFYHSRQHHDCLQKLELALRLRRGLNVVVGDVGTGKTTLCRQLIRRFANDDEIETHLILDPSYASTTDFLSEVARMFKGYRPSIQAKDWQLKEIIKQFLFRSGVDQNKTVVLIIDEGQKIPDLCLEILREFLNYETNDYKLLQIVIFAQKEFEDTIKAHPNFADRINLYHHLDPLNFGDTRRLISYRLEKSGSRKKRFSYFTLPAMVGIFWATRGYPRKIIHLCHRCILTMIIQNRSTVNFYTVRSCIPRVFPQRARRRYRGVAITAMLVAAGLLVAAGIAQMWPNGFWGATDSNPRPSLAVVDTDASGLQPVTSDRDAENGSGIQSDPETLSPSGAEPNGVPPPDELLHPSAEETSPGAGADPVPEKPVRHRPPDSLGQITMPRNETLSGIIQTVYGTFNSKYFRLLILANPHIEDPDRIEVGQIINLPAIPASVSKPPGNAQWWIQINRTDRIADALALTRSWPPNAPAIRPIPTWHPDKGYQVWIIARQTFENKAGARQLLDRLPSDFAATSKVVAVQTKDIVFFADPFI